MPKSLYTEQFPHLRSRFVKKIVLVLAAVVAVAAVSGCASVRNPASVAKRVYNTQDEYSRSDIFRAPRFNTTPFLVRATLPWADSAWVHLRLVRDPQHGVDRQLVVEFDEELGWSYFGTAYDRMGHRLNVNGLGLIAPCPDDECFYSDTVAVSLPAGYLESYARSGRGLDLKFYGLFGERVVQVPAGYVEGFVQALSTPSR